MTKILVVDDDLTTRTLIKMLLELEGFQPIIASTELEEILNLISSHQPDLLFIDVHLHNISGIEVVQRIRQESRFNSLIILMTSGMDVRDQCIKAGANGFLLKPFMPDELITWIRKNSAVDNK